MIGEMVWRFDCKQYHFHVCSQHYFKVKVVIFENLLLHRRVLQSNAHWLVAHCMVTMMIHTSFILLFIVTYSVECILGQ